MTDDYDEYDDAHLSTCQHDGSSCVQDIHWIMVSCSSDQSLERLGTTKRSSERRAHLQSYLSPFVKEPLVCSSLSSNGRMQEVFR